MERPRIIVATTIIVLFFIAQLRGNQSWTINIKANQESAQAYISGDFKTSRDQRKQLTQDCTKGEVCAELLHNYGNALLYYGSGLEANERLASREQALLAYSGSLRIIETQETRHNYDTLNSLLQQQGTGENQQQGTGDEQQGSGDNQEGVGEDGRSPNEEGEGQQQGSGDNQEGVGEDSRPSNEEGGSDDQQGAEEEGNPSDENKEGVGEDGHPPTGDGEAKAPQPQLTPDQKQQIEQYAQMLQQQQLQNQQFFNKKSQQDQFMDPFQSFFGIPQLGQQFNNDPNKKDW